ncbi:MAG: ABC transporter substrate-binding protein [Piscinibacter sp.]|nr:ABC transporter substrate-binding protein [Piscinibacter sp.]
MTPTRRDVLVGVAALPGLWVAGRTAAKAPRPRIGFIASGAPDPAHPLVRALAEGLSEQGFVDGRNVSFVFRGAGGSLAGLPAIAAELAALPVDVIVASNNNYVEAARQASATIPIVMVLGIDPVRHGFIESYARPGGRVTGLTNAVGAEVNGKLLGMLKEVLPQAAVVGVLVQQGVGYDRDLTEEAARRLRLRLFHAPEVQRAADIEPAFEAMRQAGAQAVFVVGGAVIYAERSRVVELALRHRLPAVHFSAEYVRAGGLLSYGTDLVAQFRRAGYYVARILQGVKPADLPVEQPVRFEMAINLKTAKALGLTIPQPLLLRADEVIE